MKVLCVGCIILAVFSLCTLSEGANSISTNEPYPGNGILLTLGHELILQCNNTNNPSAPVQWLFNNKPINSSDTRIKVDASTHSLIIEDASENDCGNYTCLAGGDTATISVKSAVKLLNMENSRNVVQNQNIILTCNVTQGVPLPVIKWMKDNAPLNVSDPRIEMKADKQGIEGSELVISDAQFDDRAEYTCVASNDFSSANATILVRVKDKYAALWPFLGICAEVAILCTIIFIYEKRRQKPDFDETETEHNTENKTLPDQEGKSGEVRHRK